MLDIVTHSQIVLEDEELSARVSGLIPEAG